MKIQPPPFPFRTIEVNADKSIRLLTEDWLGDHFICINGKVTSISDCEISIDREKATALFHKICAEHEIEEMKRTGTVLAG